MFRQTGKILPLLLAAALVALPLAAAGATEVKVDYGPQTDPSAIAGIAVPSPAPTDGKPQMTEVQARQIAAELAETDRKFVEDWRSWAREMCAYNGTACELAK